TSSAKGKVLRDVLDVWIRMLAPFIPHVCEEIWKMIGKDGFVSLANWPSVEVRNLEVEFAEAFVDEIVEDISEIKKVIGKETPDIVCIYVAEEWKWKVCRMALEQMKKGKIDFDALLTEARRFAEDMTEKELAKILQTMIAEVRKASPEEIEAIRKGVNEFDILSDAIRYIAGQVGAREVRVFRESDEEKYDPAGRAKRSLPLRPAVYVE
ncbi:MAG: class I tRNA ligase family protein, partial [Candidatus Hadarchaeales archaeon]